MPADETTSANPVGVGAVGLRPGQADDILAAMPRDERFALAAYCDEGLRGQEPGDGSVAYYTDYNVMLQDPAVELILVGGPPAKRRDFAVRALNAGRHAVLELPFCEEAADAERVMKIALRKGLIATAELPWRRDPDLRAVQAALAGENLGAVDGLLCSISVPKPEADARPERGGLLDRLGLPVLDRVNLVLGQDVKSVNAHARRPVAPAGGRESAFLIYMPLRSGGWAIVQAAFGPTGLPCWTLYTAEAVITAGEGRAAVLSGEDVRTYDPPPREETFWERLYRAVRQGAEAPCHPAGIVRAMKLLEAAYESIETGDPVTI